MLYFPILRVVMRILILLSLIAVAGCYRMPEDDDFCVIPNTNNPNITRSSGHQSALPGMKM